MLLELGTYYNYDILTITKPPFLYKSPISTPPAAAAASSEYAGKFAKFILPETFRLPLPVIFTALILEPGFSPLAIVANDADVAVEALPNKLPVAVSRLASSDWK
jgi:hypothetical protein